MNKKVAAGIGLIAGALGLYLLTRKKAKPCAEGATKCVGADLYACVSGKWELTEANSPACVITPPPECTTEGETKCFGTDLYSCVAGKWELAETNSPSCYITEECTVEGETRCFGTNLCTCIAGRWRLTEPSSTACGYVPPPPVWGMYYNPWGGIRTETYYCHHVPGHADYCEAEGAPASPPYWEDRGALCISMANLYRGWWGQFSGLSIAEDVGRLAIGAYWNIAPNLSSISIGCPLCGEGVGTVGGDYPTAVDSVLKHIELKHQNFPLDKPPCWIAHNRQYRYFGIHFTSKEMRLTIDGIEDGNVKAVTPGTYQVKLEELTETWLQPVVRTTIWEGSVTLSNWGDRALFNFTGPWWAQVFTGLEITTWDSIISG